ncbi:S-layer homology domain-containing protein [Proteiniborus sp. MB09-C3]|uniref:S-layer homology domain-containing protein n=1 Tax=Proteiniborus sp. MB09-C3 TaxID=3050072 RepID=UPI0025531C96|nr:S-layer homology domain-containing protein [Proteiniborus sp. MB09-C3]WIV12236.1 S-layer homology domain-containing protein [Proteiniborus sp. MB09-C3]
MRMKKIISLTLTLVLVFSIGMTSVHASGWGNGMVPPGLAKKTFNDIDAFKWAEKSIEKMFQKGFIFGVGNDMFAPKAAVTKLEAIIMSLRVMGWEEEAKGITNLPKKYKGDKVANWATGYVTIAYEKGILDDVDMMYFKPNDPALRHEVAKYVVRALGYEKEAQKNMNKEIPFVDAALVPQGSVGYVYLVNDFGLMQGDNQKRFNPMGTMTRAEMAVLFSRIDDKVDTGKDGAVSGEVTRIYSNKISVKTKDKTETFDLDSRVRVYQDDKRIDIDDIKVGTKVKMEIKDGKVVFIEVVDVIEDDKIITRYKGTVKEINKSKPYKLAIQAETMIIMFEVVDDVEVSFKGENGSFSGIQKDDEVTAVVDRKNRVIKIEVARKYVKPVETVKGYITNIELSRRYNKITIDKKTYDLDAEAKVKIDGRNKELADLKLGMYVDARLEEDVVMYIDAENKEKTISGNVIDITKSVQGTSLKIKENKTNKEYIYLVQKDASVYIEGLRNAKIEDIRKGDKGEFEILNDVIVDVYIDTVAKAEEVEGSITNLELTRRYNKIAIDKKTYDIKADAKVKIDGKNKALADLKIGMYAKLVLEDGVVVSIDAENAEKIIEGEIISITKDFLGTTLKIKEEDTDKEYSYPVHKNVKIYIKNVRNAKIEDLLKGDEGEFTILNGSIVEIDIED